MNFVKPVHFFAILSLLVAQGCVPMRKDALPSSDPPLPRNFPGGSSGGPSSALTDWRQYFRDPNLTTLIGIALANNQELNILLQEINVSKAEVRARKGAIFPFVTLGGTAGLDKVGKHTREGAVEEGLEIEPERRFPDPLTNFGFAADFDWEVDIWRKLRNERDAAVKRYFGTQEGRNFMVTNIVSVIAESYYELLALDNKLSILQRTIGIQSNALSAVKLQKDAAKVTELAVRRFEAEVLKNKSLVFEIQQQIVVMENRINYLVGRYPQHVKRNASGFETLMLANLRSGLPSDLLRNRPDVRKAELELAATGFEFKAAAARFYPALNISAALGLQSFTLGSAFSTPGSLIYGAAANAVGPLINRSQINAAYNTASAKQIAAVYEYQQTVLKAYIEVVNQLAQMRNLNQAYDLKTQQVQALSDSIDISGKLFNNARADYTEVLFTQRDTLEARVDLVELKQQQLAAYIKAYKALGGGYTRPNAPPPAP